MKSDQTGRMPRLIWVFAGCTVILLVLSWDSWYNTWLLMCNIMTPSVTHSINEPCHEKTCLWGLSLVETNRPAQLQRLARVLKFQQVEVEVLYCPGSEQQRHWSDCADGQADPRLCCSHTGFLMICKTSNLGANQCESGSYVILSF